MAVCLGFSHAFASARGLSGFPAQKACDACRADLGFLMKSPLPVIWVVSPYRGLVMHGRLPWAFLMEFPLPVV